MLCNPKLSLIVFSRAKTDVCQICNSFLNELHNLTQSNMSDYLKTQND